MFAHKAARMTSGLLHFRRLVLADSSLIRKPTRKLPQRTVQTPCQDSYDRPPRRLGQFGHVRQYCRESGLSGLYYHAMRHNRFLGNVRKMLE